MQRHRLDVLEPYEVTGQPVVTQTRLQYVPWVQQAVQPYRATRLPVGSTHGLWDALQRARRQAGPTTELLALSPGAGPPARRGVAPLPPAGARRCGGLLRVWARP